MKRLAYAILALIAAATVAAGPAAAVTPWDARGVFVQVQGDQGRQGRGGERGERGRDGRQDRQGRNDDRDRRERMSDDDRRSLHRDLDKANRELYGRRPQK